MKYLIFNLKSKLNYQDLESYYKPLVTYQKDIVIVPSYLYLNYFLEKGFTVGAQDVSKFPKGNFTGEVNAEALKSIGCEFVLIGHYERRKYFKEKKEDLISKIKESLSQNLKIILCLSENKSKYNFKIIKKQIDEIFSQLSIDDLKQIILAYEPSFLIGQSSLIDIKKVSNIINNLNAYVLNKYYLQLDIIYGGSVNLNNFEKLKQLPVSGFLIGEVSTQLDEVLTLLEKAKQ